MTKDTKKVDIPADLRPVIAAAAKNLATHLYGPQGPAWGTSFASIEEMADQIARLLGAEMIGQAVKRQAGQSVPAELQSCPGCSGPLDEKPSEPRSVRTTTGIADWQEPARYCPRCRRAFFPSEPSVGP